MKGKKTGGRKAGTPNKTTKSMREVLSNAVCGYYTSEQFLEDIAYLKPVERVSAMEKLAGYVLPKLQTTSLDVFSESKKTIEDRLIELSGNE